MNQPPVRVLAFLLSFRFLSLSLVFSIFVTWLLHVTINKNFIPLKGIKPKLA